MHIMFHRLSGGTLRGYGRTVLRASPPSVCPLQSGYTPRRYLSLKDEERKFSDDEKLLAEYSGLWPKIKLIFNLFQSGNVSAQLDKTIKSSTKIYGKPVARAMMPLKLYVDLENPLIKKYNFDIAEFLEGVDLAYHSAMSVIDPEKLDDQKAEQLLNDIAAPDVKAGFLEWRNAVKSKVAKVLDVKLKMVLLRQIDTEIVKKRDKPDQKLIIPIMQPAIPEVAPSADLPDDNEAILNPHADYTIGSVVATVQTDLIFELPGNFSDWDKTVSNNYCFAVFGFDGCISGQTPLEWKLTKVGFSIPLIVLNDVNFSTSEETTPSEGREKPDETKDDAAGDDVQKKKMAFEQKDDSKQNPTSDKHS